MKNDYVCEMVSQKLIELSDHEEDLVDFLSHLAISIAVGVANGRSQKQKIARHTVPYSKEAEMIVLGSMIESKEKSFHVINRIGRNDFYISEHRSIFNSILSLSKFETFDPSIEKIIKHLEKRRKDKSIGGIPYLTTLRDYCSCDRFLDEYIELLIEKRMEREGFPSPTTIMD